MQKLRSRRVRETVFLIVGTSTPVGILAVNVSAFVMRHLAEFRVGIAVCALVSGLSLNGVTAWATLGRAERFVPHLFAEYRAWAVGLGTVVVVGLSALGAYLTYLSMQDPQHLPNLYAVLTALWLLLLPVLMTVAARRLGIGTRRPEEARATATPEIAVRPNPEP